MHGGGFALGSAASNDDTNQRLAVNVPCIVVAVDYRLAPEHPYPSAVEDCITALTWVAHNAEKLGGDSDRIGVLGTSAGACLAACTALWARDHGGPTLAVQVLVEPALDDRSDSPSMKQGSDAIFWNSRNAELSWQHYLGGHAPDETTTPARRLDLSGLPPAYISVNELDPLRDQGIDYARRLLAAQVRVEMHCWPGTFHGFIMFDTELGRHAQASKLDALRRLLGHHGSEPDVS
jgi:acetyl esterase/lipase